MAYASINFKTKKDFKEAVKAGQKITLWNYAGIFEPKKNGTEYVEGQWYPKPHTWYAEVKVKDGIIISVK